MDPLLHHLKGAALRCHRPPQAARPSGPEHPWQHGSLIASPLLHHLKGAALGCHRPPQAATGCPTSWPRIQQISLNPCSRLHKSVKLLIWVHWLTQSSPNATTGLQGPSKVTPQVTKSLQNTIQTRAKSVTRRAQRQGSKHPSIHSSGARGRRQRRQRINPAAGSRDEPTRLQV